MKSLSSAAPHDQLLRLVRLHERQRVLAPQLVGEGIREHPAIHVAPNRQIVVLLTGRLEVEVSDGEKRQWGPGGMFMADDTSGKGHRTRVLEGPAKLLFMRVPDDFDPAEWTLR